MTDRAQSFSSINETLRARSVADIVKLILSHVAAGDSRFVAFKFLHADILVLLQLLGFLSFQEIFALLETLEGVAPRGLLMKAK